MRELSLFSGSGGGLLGTKLLGWNHCGYVENEDYCQRVIAQRIKDGMLDEAPIFGDIRAFINEGYAEAYQGMVDVVTAGFPCQPFSVAGKRAGADDDRNMWPQTIDVIRRVRPRVALLENVPGLCTHEYSRQIFRDLAKSGYSARWRVLSAAELGAPHIRKRLWIMAYSESERCQEKRQGKPARSGKKYSNTKSQRWGREIEPREDMVNNRLQSPFVREEVSDADTKRLQERQRSETEWTQPAIDQCNWWDFEPDVGRVADGVAYRVDRLKSLGNGQVPAVVRAAWVLLTDN